MADPDIVAFIKRLTDPPMQPPQSIAENVAAQADEIRLMAAAAEMAMEGLSNPTLRSVVLERAWRDIRLKSYTRTWPAPGLIRQAIEAVSTLKTAMSEDEVLARRAELFASFLIRHNSVMYGHLKRETVQEAMRRKLVTVEQLKSAHVPSWAWQ